MQNINGINIKNPCSLMLILTEDCQLRCTYCFEDHPKNHNMSLETAKQAVDFVYNSATEDKLIPSISFFGGEPLLRYDEIIVPVIEYIRQEKKYYPFEIKMTTNGLLLTEDKLQFLKANGVHIMLSIDGNEDAHNATRKYCDGRDCFDDLEVNIDNLLKYFPKTVARMTLTPDSVQYFKESVEFFEQQGFEYLRVYPNIYEEWDDEALQTFEEQLEQYNEYLYNTFMNDTIPLVFDMYEYMLKKIVINMHEENNNTCRTSFYCQACNRCGLGMTGNFVVDYLGNIYTCDRVDFAPVDDNIFYVGDVFNGVDFERVGKVYELNSAKPLQSKTLDCNSCELNKVCSGGCTPVNYMINGDFSVLPESYCKYNQILYRKVLELVQKFDSEQKCDLFKDFFYGSVKAVMAYVG